MLDSQEGGLLSESGRSEDIIYTDHQACLFSAETKFVACKFIWGISGNRLITHIAPRAPRITMTKLGWRVLDNMGKSPCGTANSEQDLEPFKFLYVLHSVRRSPPSTCLVCTSSAALRNLFGRRPGTLPTYIRGRRARTIFIPCNGSRGGRDISGT